jgi:hypothetical protein
MIVAVALPGQYVLIYDRSKGKMIRTEHSCVTQTVTRQRKLASGLNYQLQEISPESYVWIGSLSSVIAPHLPFDLKGATPTAALTQKPQYAKAISHRETDEELLTFQQRYL